MKKTLLFLIACFAFFAASSAQTQKGNVSLGLTARGIFANGFRYSDYTLCPGLYWFPINKLAIGADFGYSGMKDYRTPDSFYKSNEFSFYPGMRYYFRNDGKIFRPAVFCNYGKTFYANKDSYGSITSSCFSYGAVGALFSFSLNNHFAFDARVELLTRYRKQYFPTGYITIGFHITLEESKKASPESN